MGDVAVYVRIMPESTETNMEKILEDVKNVLGEKLKSAEVKPFVFGLKAIEAVFIVPDQEGVLDQEVEKIQKIEGVQNVEVLEVTLV
ncbi:MAG: elongation factor 1-beta [Euryarchaeota archaeon]|nr:elongation factor 1-beta [Euryarchaeota archaeon]